MKRNEGFTLVELLITIVVGTIAAAAAVTVMILGLRINHRSTEIATQQNNTRILLTVMERVAEETEITSVTDTAINGTLVAYDAQAKAVKVNNVALMKGITAFDIDCDKTKKLITITMTTAEGTYKSTVYCRLLQVTDSQDDETQTGEAVVSEGDAALQTAYSERNYQEVLTFAVESQENPREVTQLLSVLASQYGSRGQILTEAGEPTGEYFSEWYIGSYEENPGWNADTPWCGCYLSWALAQCDGLAETPRFANVDTMWAEFVTQGNWTPGSPAAGDLVFFDWDVDDTYDPAHVGAVLALSDDWVYTIEGNSGGRVAVCRYALEDPHILGYGQLKWK